MSETQNANPMRDGSADAGKIKTLDAAGWGFLLVWLGVTTLLSIDWAVFLIGVGLIALALQGARAVWNLAVEAFWLILGVVFIAAGLAESLGVGFPLVPVALIVFGVAALIGVYRRTVEHRR